MRRCTGPNLLRSGERKPDERDRPGPAGRTGSGCAGGNSWSSRHRSRPSVRAWPPPRCAAAAGAAALLLWQGAVWVLQIEPFIVPGPLAIAEAFAGNLANVLGAAVVTGVNAAVGLVLGALLGVAAAVAAAAVPVLDRLAAPLVVALSVIPIVALAPVLYTMFGADQQATRQIVAGIAVFIPVYVNSLRGFRQVKPVHRDLMRSYAAGEVADHPQRHPAQRSAVHVHRPADCVLAGRRLGADCRVLRRAGRRPRQVGDLRGVEQQLHAGLGLRAVVPCCWGCCSTRSPPRWRSTFPASPAAPESGAAP